MPKNAKPSKKLQSSSTGQLDGLIVEQPITHGPGAPSYEEVQGDEIEVLRAIYEEKFSDMKSKSAWSKATEKSFKLKLTAYSNETLFVTLQITLTATYPKTLPILGLSETHNVTQDGLKHIRDLLDRRPKQMLGEVMIHEIATMIQDSLEDEALAQVQKQNQKAQVPSLDEERASEEARATKLAAEQQEVAARHRASMEAEEERKTRMLVDEGLRKRLEVQRRRKSEALDTQLSQGTIDSISFDQPVSFKDQSGQDRIFQSVALLPATKQGIVSNLCLAVPLITEQSKSSTLIMKQVNIPQSRTKRSMLDLESLLEKLKHIKHSNIAGLLEFRISEEDASWNFDLLIERASQGSLNDMLKIVDTLPANKARLWGIELLQGLDFLHRNGIVHGRLHPGNILFHQPQTGAIVPMLSDGGYEDYFYALTAANTSKEAMGSRFWLAPEIVSGKTTEKTRKTDLWDFGTCIVLMLFGLDACNTYQTPANFHIAFNLSDSFHDLLSRLLHHEPRSRPTPTEVILYEFFRTGGSATRDESPPQLDTKDQKTFTSKPLVGRLRHESSSGPVVPSSRYGSEWDEIARLGKGGFGEVVKSRNKHDGRLYAIKKIAHNTPSELSGVLSEVYLLATLNHPYVVRYYTAWPEEESGAQEGSSEQSSSAFPTEDSDESFGPSFAQSGRGLDFMSSSGYPKIEFGYDDEDEEAIESDDSDTESESISSLKNEDVVDKQKNVRAALAQRRPSRLIKSTLYIQMELCERFTLRDTIRKGLSENLEEIWRLFRAVLEGLAHIHGHGIIHRDLKPENIFIDSAQNPRIGDFGLATTGNVTRTEETIQSHDNEPSMTSNVGTTFYIAPEMQTKGSGNLTDKVDMYSLGIVFFEMCFPLHTGMERMHVLNDLRQKTFLLPSVFQQPEKLLQGEIIHSLLSHKPSARPSCAELLRSGKLPAKIEDETVLLALKGLTDENDPNHHKMMAALFAKGLDRNVQARTWDLSDKEASQSPSIEFLMIQDVVKERLTACFQRHGAVEIQRQGPIPQSDYYENKDSFQMLDASGTLLQLPYDLTLPLARRIARQGNMPQKVFTFGTVWRDALNNGAPRSTREVDFDIITYDSKDNVLKEAEVVKTMDEILDEIPALTSAPMCYHISHSKLLSSILSFSRIDKHQHRVVKETLVRLNIQGWTWQKIRSELRGASIGVPSTSLDELARFDFRDTPEKTLTRLQAAFVEPDEARRLSDVFIHISGFIEYCRRLGIKRKIYISPLSNFNESFYTGGIMFQCLFDTKKRDILAAGGRYDSLVQAHRLPSSSSDQPSKAHAVGINISWDRIVTSMVRYQGKPKSNMAFLKKSEDSLNDTWLLRRCDVLVASFDPTILRSSGVRLVSELWAQDISAELAGDSDSFEELVSRHRTDNHALVILIKHDLSGPASLNAKAELKIRSMDKKEEYDIRSSELIPFLRAELRDREGGPRMSRQQSHTNDGTASSFSSSADVHVVMASHKSKKSNKMRIVESAREAAQKLMRQSTSAPIVAIETKDEVLEKIRNTKLSDPESWRKLAQDVPLTERMYVADILNGIEKVNSMNEGASSAGRNCFVYNFRTGGCILYDMKL